MWFREKITALWELWKVGCPGWRKGLSRVPVGSVAPPKAARVQGRPVRVPGADGGIPSTDWCRRVLPLGPVAARWSSGWKLEYSLSRSRLGHARTVSVSRGDSRRPRRRVKLCPAPAQLLAASRREALPGRTPRARSSAPRNVPCAADVGSAPELRVPRGSPQNASYSPQETLLPPAPGTLPPGRLL